MSDLPASKQDASRIIDAFPAAPGLYLHIPFCTSICPFCPYNRVIYDRETARAYLDALEQEVHWYTRQARRPFTSLYVGGGTPTLCIDELGRIVDQVKTDGERGIEVLPSHATPANLYRLGELGFNYLSLGIQSFDEGVLAHLQRPNTTAENHRAMDETAGRFDCVDVDLIFDVAFERKEIFLRDLEICFRAGVEQVSTYPLMRFGYTPFGKADHRAREEQRILRSAEELAAKYGYERRSVWTFGRQESPNYTSITREFYLGCGAGSGSFSGSMFFLNHFSVSDYIAKVSAGKLPIARETLMSPMRAAAYYLFWQAYTGHLNIKRFAALFPRQRLLRTALWILGTLGWMRQSGDDVALTPSGYNRYHDLERWVTYHFIEPLWADMMREHAHLQDSLPDRSRSDRFWLHLSGLQS